MPYIYHQRYRIFFSPEKFTGHSFIQIPKCCFFFFPRSGKKKYKLIFFYYGKSSSVIHLDFEEIRFFLQNWLCFFSRIFVWFLCFFFPRKSSHVIHSFNFGGRKKKTQSGKKKTAFSFIHSIFLKNAQKRTYPGK